MKRAIPLICAALMLSACANIQAEWTALTSTQVNPSDVYIAENVYIAAEQLATGYLHICRTTPKISACAPSVIKATITGIRDGETAIDNLDAFMTTHPDALGASGLYDAVVAATKTLQSFATTYTAAKGN